MITDSQWKTYLSKYEKLMWKISRMISGDPTIANIEDNFSDLSVSALESIKGFKKKTGQEFDDFIQSKLFDGYTKTCLWKHKAKKGALLTKRMPFTNKLKSLNFTYPKTNSGSGFIIYANTTDSPFEYFIEDKNSGSGIDNFIIRDQVKDLDNAACKIVDLILNNEDVLTTNLRVNCAAISRESDLSIHEINKSLDNLRNKLE